MPMLTLESRGKDTTWRSWRKEYPSKLTPISATGLIRTRHTTKPRFPTTKSHRGHLVGDSALKA